MVDYLLSEPPTSKQKMNGDRSDDVILARAKEMFINDNNGAIQDAKHNGVGKNGHKDEMDEEGKEEEEENEWMGFSD